MKNPWAWRWWLNASPEDESVGSTVSREEYDRVCQALEVERKRVDALHERVLASAGRAQVPETPIDIPPVQPVVPMPAVVLGALAEVSQPGTQLRLEQEAIARDLLNAEWVDTEVANAIRDGQAIEL